jgi:hypothetical protein
MSRLLTAFSNMLEASVRSPEQFPGPRPAPAEADRRLRVVALLRALTSEEATALLRDNQHPARLATLANKVGLPVEECGRVLAGVVWKLTEGLRPLPDTSRQEAEPSAPADGPSALL